jgi:prepilin-type N-terminal cleavage/methylation domain-containing protein
MNINISKGFTLIEMLVGVAIFSVIIVAMTGIFVSAIRSQVATLDFNQLLDETSYNIEYMSRALRMAKKDLTGACLTTAGAGRNYEISATSDRIRFLNYEGYCQEFYLDGEQLKEKKSSSGSASDFPLQGTPLTSDNVKVNYFNIYLMGDGQPPFNYDQPRVTLSLNLEPTRKAQQYWPALKIQTSISQRDLDIQE